VFGYGSPPYQPYTCSLCSRSNLLPMFPVCSVTVRLGVRFSDSCVVIELYLNVKEYCLSEYSHLIINVIFLFAEYIRLIGIQSAYSFN
jgi:hypothetical protein